jgi:hypothetical protein
LALRAATAAYSVPSSIPPVVRRNTSDGVGVPTTISSKVEQNRTEQYGGSRITLPWSANSVAPKPTLE